MGIKQDYFKSIDYHQQHNVFFPVPFLLHSTRPIIWNKISFKKIRVLKKKITKTLTLSDRPLGHTHTRTHIHTHTHTHTHMISRTAGKDKRWSEGWESVGWRDFVRKSVPDRQWYIEDNIRLTYDVINNLNKKKTNLYAFVFGLWKSIWLFMMEIHD